ncbi:MAG: ECF-type sigma factor [Planctomycetota bacterium JB042]
MNDRELARVEATVSQWIEGLRGGDERAAGELWRRYFRRLVALADARLPRSRRSFDEEDVALSAFHSLCEGVRGGRFPALGRRDELWSLLAVITARKAAGRRRGEAAQKRGGGAEPDGAEVTSVLGAEPTPEFAAEVAEESERLLAALPDDAMRDIALRKLEGYTNEEIAADLDCAVRTVERRLGLIRRLWAERAP